MRGKIAIAIEMLGATCIAIGLYLWSPAVSLIWVGAMFILLAWSISGRSTDGDTNT